MDFSNQFNVQKITAAVSKETQENQFHLQLPLLLIKEWLKLTISLSHSQPSKIELVLISILTL